jgi:hypothetical protein
MNTDILNQQKLTAAVAAIVASVKAKEAHGGESRGDNETALSKVRDLAKVAVEAGADVKAVAEYLSASLVAGGVKANTARPYATAFRGFGYATKDGKDITAYEKKANGKFRSMSAGEAQAHAKWVEMTAAERAQAEAAAELDAIRAEIGKRIKAINDRATLEAFRDQLPEVEGEAREETAAQKAQREASEAARIALAAALGGTEAEAEPVGAAQAA